MLNIKCVYRISMIVVELMTKIIEFDTRILKKWVSEKMCYPRIFFKEALKSKITGILQGQATNCYHFKQNRRKFMILVTTIRVFSYARDSGVTKSTLDIALLVKSNMAAIFSKSHNLSI